ncbi:hypothetical protein ACQP2F_36215 [Actinoplanes sp. CA-030573]|uniref:hypothetical protein n=1 Tax=Actinoplanes sp. CA-030573 TaxID=3239898 RepID=UPI003D90D867
MTAPEMSALDDLTSLLAEVDYYESRPGLDAGELERYLRAAAALGDLIMAEAVRRQKELRFADAEVLLGQFLQLNETKRKRCERARRHQDDDSAHLAGLRDAAAADVLLAEGLQHVCRADERRLAGDFDTALRCLATATKCFEQLAASSLPLRRIGAWRLSLTRATTDLMTGLGHMRAGDFRGAHQSFDNAYVAFGELLDRIGEEPPDLPAHAQYDEVRDRLVDGRRYLEAVQSFVEMLREAQSGRYGDAVLAGQEAVDRYQRLVREAVTQQAPRTARLLYEMDLARVNGWLSWATAELAVDEARWQDCRDQVRLARTQWKQAAHIAARTVYHEIVAQRPEPGDTEMLLQNTLRRCDRELQFRKEIEALNAKLDRAATIVIQNQGGRAVAPSDFTFNAPVSATSIGNENRIENATANQQVAGGTDLRELAAQLRELRDLLAGAARTPQEQSAVAAVEAAQDAATRGDEPTMRRYLADAGKWALQIAEQIGVAAATAAIKSALGA